MDSNSSSDPLEASGNPLEASSGGNVAVGSKTRVVLAPKWLGKRVGRFKLLALLGQGAMGRVFRAEDTLMARHVALKLLPRTLKRGHSSVAAEMLIREARTAAAIEHPGAVQIYEINEAGDVYYIAMELLEGGSLRDLVKAAGPLDVTRACLLAAEAAEALAHAHSVGVVHRDVKPANLMLTRTGRCKVVDFGLARVEDPSDLTSFLAESVGTPQFIAPEILTGTPASAQSDIYSLGATIWYLLCGHPPFEAGTAQDLLQKHVSAPLPDLRAICPHVPQGLADALSTALSKRPMERYSSMEQFAKVLRVQSIPIAASAEHLELPPAPPAAPVMPSGPARPASPLAPQRPASPGAAIPSRPARPATPFDPPQALEEPEAAPEEQLAPSRVVQQSMPWWKNMYVLAGGGIAAAILLVVACVMLLRPSSNPPPLTSNTPTAVPAPVVTPPPRTITPAAPVQAVAPAIYLVAQWRADDYTSGEWLDRLHNLAARPVNAPKADPGVFNGHAAIKFNGKNQYFTLRGSDYPLADGNSMTVIAVFKPVIVGPRGPQFWHAMGLVGADLKDTVDDWGLGWGGTSGKQVVAGAGNFPPSKDGTIPSHDLELNRVHVAAMTWQMATDGKPNATITLWVDGQQVRQETKTSEPRTRDNSIAFGASSGSGLSPFAGDIAEIRFYSDSTEDIPSITDELMKTYTGATAANYNPNDPNGLLRR